MSMKEKEITSNRPLKRIAHARQMANGEWDKPHLLQEHLDGVATFAFHFADKFGNSDWGRAAGLLHDLGKGSYAFQAYIRTQSGYDLSAHLETELGKGRVTHSTHGAVWANDEWKGIGKILAYLIAGHHGGLPNWNHQIGGGGNLADRLQKSAVEQLPKLPKKFIEQTTQSVKMPLSTPCGEALAEEFIHLWIRLLYSCLVDADFLDTERYMNGEQHSLRSGHSSLKKLKQLLDFYMASFGTPKSVVNKVRASVLQQCRERASDTAGLFTLTVPTGGGKTLASMAFALEHALNFAKNRVIMVIPYTSIIEQTAQVYKDIFGEENVLEHHSSLDPEKENRESRLATENWDAPIVVTTNVQFFESLFAAKSSACRKLHNIVNSVVIIDEVQMLPTDYLKPILQVVKGLTDHFKVTMVLCSATQPAVTGTVGSGKNAFAAIAPSDCKEIMQDPNPVELTKALQRVEVQQLGKFDDWSVLATELTNHESVLCVVNTRRDCRELFDLMPSGTIHLSANMCGEHRSVVIEAIKQRLQRGEFVRVVSTQLVEAGVDFDFPVVFRAMAGFDSIAQAAGRCNREGKLDRGLVFVFEPPRAAPLGQLRKGAQAGKTILSVDPEGCKNLLPSTFTRYFQFFFGDLKSFDKKDMHSLLVRDATEASVQFRTAAKLFKMIDDQNQVSVVVKHRGRKTDSRVLIQSLRNDGPGRTLMRKLQRFTVTLPENAFKEISGSFEEVHGIWCQDADTIYDETLGFVGNDGEIPIC